MKNFVKFIEEPFFILCLLLGKVPIWVLFLGLFLPGNKINIESFVCFFFAIIIANIFLSSYSNSGSMRIKFFVLIRQILLPLFLILSYFALVIAIGRFEKDDVLIISSMFFCLAFIFLIKFFFIKEKSRGIFLRDGGILKIAKYLLWLYFVIFSDGIVLSIFSLCAIYLLEYFSNKKFTFYASNSV